MNQVLVANDVKKKFGQNMVLNGINLEIGKGNIFSVIGPSGAGKTTLLKALAGLIPTDDGKIELDGTTVNSPSKDIGLVFQDFNLWPHKTVLENVAEPLILIGKKPRDAAEKQALDLLELVELQDKKDCYPDSLSGGQRQRTAIARALAMNPKVLLLDEITSALDPELISGINRIIRRLAGQGQTMIIVTHDLYFAKEISDKILFLDSGVILEEGTPSEIFNSPRNPKTKNFLAAVSNRKYLS